MVIASLIGSVCIGLSAAGALFHKADNRFRTRLQRSMKDYKVYHQTDTKAVIDPAIKKVEKTEYGYSAEVELPSGYPVSKFEQHLEGLEQSTAAKIRFRHKHGRLCSLQFGLVPLYDKMGFRLSLLDFRKPLSIPFYTPFGVQRLDLGDETSCHFLNGGASRMGKTALLRMIATILMKQTVGNIRITFMDNKINDLWMFRKIPQIQMAETLDETLNLLKDVTKQIGIRKQLLKDKGNVVDLIELRKKYPNEKVDPIVVIIDEYGRLAGKEDINKEIEDCVVEIAETAGYVDIHLIVAAQRPDASEVLSPRIKANLLPRIAFSTANEANSNIILGIPDAAKLGSVQGRAILIDGRPEVVQVPFLSTARARALLRPFYKGEDNEPKGQKDTEISKTLPGFVTDSLGTNDMPGGSESIQDGESDNETDGKGRIGNGGAAGKGPNISIHAQSADNSNRIEQDKAFLGLGGPVYHIADAEHLRGRAADRRKLHAGRIHKNPPSDHH